MAATTAKLLGDIHPLAIHRRHHLVLTLILPGKLEEARRILARSEFRAAWGGCKRSRLKAELRTKLRALCFSKGAPRW